MVNFESYGVNLHILSPIHIGSGQELDPFSYFIRDERLLLFDLPKWMAGYANKEELNEVMDSEDFIALRAYISEKFDDDSAILGSIPIKSPEVISTYRKAIKDKNSENQALVNFMTRNEINRTPYIPGSSIKGAIRTAIANRFVKKAGVTKYNKKKIFKPRFEPDYNEKIFGKPDRDPMKNLKISDASLNVAGSFIYEAKEHSQKPEKTPKGGFEASASLCELDSSVILPLHFSLKNSELFGKKIDIQFIIDALHDFYMPKFKDEHAKFYCGPDTREIQQAIAPINMAAVMLNSNEAFIRIGHFSHVECVTLDHVRDPKTRRGKDGKPLPWGMTRTLANGLYPFGWAKIEFVDLPAKPRQEKEWPFSVQEIENNVRLKKRSDVAS